jgi:hypothetical protein
MYLLITKSTEKKEATKNKIDITMIVRIPTSSHQQNKRNKVVSNVKPTER